MDDGSSTNGKGQRPRLTCTECYRRKIRCDKTIPCGTCIRRGYATFCTRDDITNAGAPPAYQSQRESEVPTDLVRALLDRVGQLEAKLQEQGITVLHDSPDGSPSQPMTPVNNGIPAPPPNSITTPLAVSHEDTATVLEFLAWGRKKDAEYGSAQEQNNGPKRLDISQNEDTSASIVVYESSKDAQLDMLEALLPSRSHIAQLVDYHNVSLLWYHGSYSATILKDELDAFLIEYGGDVRHQDLNLQWLALLFAILTGSMTCAPPSILQTWSFSEAERAALSTRWYEATVTCLNMACYIETHEIYSVQAIATLTISAHTLGKSNSQSVLLASAGRIAQSLGLHRLKPETTSIPIDQLRKREAGRRVFNQLCTQDWFQIPFSESYSLNPSFIHAAKPLNCNDDDMLPQPQITPTQASYINYRFEIARLMPQLLDATANCNTLFTKYEQVLQYDDRMRKLATAYMPTFLSANAPVAENWPIYVGWARRSLAICAAHKIIMIHRKFLGLSFTNTAFSFTRRTCIAASKTILKEALSPNNEHGPMLWIEQAFSVAAGIILGLDTLYRNTGETEFEEHSRLVADAIDYLKKFENSKVASRGVQLLSALQLELGVEGGQGPTGSRKRHRRDDDRRSNTMPTRKRTRRFDIDGFVKNVSQNLRATTPVVSPSNELPGSSVGDGAWNSFVDTLSPQTGFAGQSLFDDLLAFQF